MKRLFNIMLHAVAFAGIMACISSCIPDGIHHRGGMFDPDPDPSRPGGDGSDPTDVIELKYGYADYYGQYYTDDTDNYLVYLYVGDTDDKGYFINKGYILTLDLLLAKGSKMQISPGTYKCSDSGDTPSFIPTYKETDGSSLYYQKNKDDYTTYEIMDGTVNIQRKITGSYDIEANIVIKSGGEYTFTFSGFIDIEDKTKEEPVDPVNPDDPQQLFPGTSDNPWQARALYYGKCADNPDADEYTLYLSAGKYDSNGIDFVIEGTEVAVEVLTEPSDGKTIKAGTYTCCSADNPAPYRFYDGFWQDDSTLLPSYLYRQYKSGETSLESITGGTLEVAMTNGDYQFTYTFNCGSKTYKFRTDPLKVKFERPQQASQAKTAELSGHAYRLEAGARAAKPAGRDMVSGRVAR